MNLSSLPKITRAGLLAGAAFGCALSLAAAEKDAFPVFDSYIKVTGQAAAVTGSESSAARRLQAPENGTWGIEALRYSKDLKDNASLSFEGKALSGKEDYLGALKFTKEETGTFEVGYKRFRTFYDGIGGFFPLNNRWMELGNPELHTDRAKFWAEARIERPNAPKFELRYTNELRSGRKDSTIWGDTDFTGIPSYYGVGAAALNPYSPNRKIVPAYIDLNERQQNWLGAVKHTVGNTELEFEIQHNIAKTDDRRTVNRYPGELQLYPRQSSSTNPPQVYPAATIGNEIQGYDRVFFETTITSYVGKFETHFTDTVSVNGGVLYTTGSADIGGDRQMLQFMPTAIGTVSAVGGFVGATGRPAYSYKTTSGKTNETVKAVNLGAKYKPSKDFTGSVALKYEKTDVDGYNNVLYMSNRIDQATGVITPINSNAPNVADRSEKTWVPEAEVRYTGIKNLALYGTFDYRHSPGTEYGSSQSATTGGGLGTAVVSYDNIKVNHYHYKAGANWTVNPMVTLRGEVYFKDHTNGFYGFASSAGSSYVLGYEFFGTKLSAIVKPVSNVTFTTRLLRQSGKMDTIVDGEDSWQSNDTKNYQIGETIDWAPSARTFVQANLNVTYNTIQTAYPSAGGLANDVLRNADNNYRSGSLITGFVVDKDTDASLEYTFYRADNYKVPTYATVFYGAGAKEYTVAAKLKRRLTEKLVGYLKVGYIDSENETTGGNTNFKGPMVYLSLEQAL